jgi:hypothetical protein
MKTRMLLVLVLVLFAACASSGGGAAMYQSEIGTASLIDAMRASELMINRYHYEVDERDTIPFVRIQTHWRPRTPLFADEQALGITAAESRLIITARARGTGEEMSAVHNVRLVVENRVRVAGSVEWNESTNTPMFKAYADKIRDDFKREFTNIGVRRY